MNSRLERYDELNQENKLPSRLQKNQIIYNDINNSELLNVKTNSNVKVIEDLPREINIEKIKKYVLSINEEAPRKKVSLATEETVENVADEKPSEDKIYDINSVLEKARQGREQDYEQNRYRKLRDTQYDILSKIKMYDDSEKPNYEEEFNTDERTLIDLINTVTLQKEKESLLSELEGDDNTIVTSSITEESQNTDIREEIKKQLTDEQKEENKNVLPVATTESNKENDKIKEKIDNSFYTNSMSFSKDDFEVFEELEKAVKKNSSLVKVGVVFLILLGITTILVILKFIFNIELF